MVDLPFRPADRGLRHRADHHLRRQRLARQWLEPLGIQVAFTWIGVVVALTLIGLPFVVRTVQPAWKTSRPSSRRPRPASAPGAGRRSRLVILPALLPALLTGFAMAFARAIGEYGSVIFIAGNMPMRTEIAPLLIVIKLEQYDYTGATAIAVVMLVASFLMLLVINLLQWWSRRYQVAAGASRWHIPFPLRCPAQRPEGRAAPPSRPGAAAADRVALLFLGLFLFLPLAVVFTEALRAGIGAYPPRSPSPTPGPRSA
jgi:ABC-type sulfate transport system permease component